MGMLGLFLKNNKELCSYLNLLLQILMFFISVGTANTMPALWILKGRERESERANEPTQKAGQGHNNEYNPALLCVHLLEIDQSVEHRDSRIF